MSSKKLKQAKPSENVKSTSKTPKKYSIAQKIIAISFLFIFFIILFAVICLDWLPHCTNKNFIIPNIASLLISLVLGSAFYFLFKKISISKKAFLITVIAAFLFLYVAQLLILYFSYFKTGWDAGTVNDLADMVVEQGVYTTAGSSAYLTIFENNVLIVTILAFIKSLPIIGGKYFTILAINALLVNLSGVFTCLTIRKLLSRKAGILSIFISTPLILLSPWIMIPYSDTFAIIIPILTFFIYIATNKWWKYGLIIFFSLIGYFIKPSAIIVLIAIIIIELLKHRWHKPKVNKDFWLRTLAIANGVLLAFLIKYVSFSYINYQQNKDVIPITFIHYLAMGQNGENYGQFLTIDSQEFIYGPKFELQKFYDRFTNRSLLDQIDFFTRKLLVNYDDGTFAWSGEGEFYKEIPERNNPISNILTNFYYSKGDNNRIFIQIEQIIWIFVLFGCLFSFRKKSPPEETVLKLSLIGIFIFVMIFEARARYLFCFAPMFIVCSILGYHNLANLGTIHIKKIRSAITATHHK